MKRSFDFRMFLHPTSDELAAYALESCGDGLGQAMRRHLTTCSECRRAERALRSLIMARRPQPPLTPSPILVAKKLWPTSRVKHQLVPTKAYQSTRFADPRHPLRGR